MKINSIVRYYGLFFFVDKMYKTNGKFDGMVRIRSFDDERITIRITSEALTLVSN